MLVTGAQPIEAISLEDMGYSFGPKVKPMFVGLNYEFKKGTSYWIKGGSGSGKSSLLKVISVLATPLGGDVLINGQSTRAMTFEEFLPYRLQIGYSFELGGLLSNKSLFENLILPLQYHKLMPEDEAKTWIEELATLFELTEFLHSRPSQVSGSIKKATVVARALVLQPRVLILDEPTIGLSQSRKDTLGRLIHEWREAGKLAVVVIASDDVSFARKATTKTLELKSQKIEEIESVHSAFIVTHKKASS
ncbi:MAG: ATP-binding cassette domain-containing protein [Bdellovibrionales bacterium]|nr:ATP-binding cassette domain-containing protein [Bdellovibrionales bacterium]